MSLWYTSTDISKKYFIWFCVENVGIVVIIVIKLSSNNYDYSNRTLRPFVIHDHEIWKRIKIEHELSEDTSDIVRTSNIKFHDLSSCKTLVYNPHPLHIVTMIFLEAPTASIHETNTRTKVWIRSARPLLSRIYNSRFYI